MTSTPKGRMFISVTTILLLFILVLTCNPTSGLNNGLARTPPMGWMSWVRFACEINCTLYPKDCIDQNLYMEMADKLAYQGYKEAGYQYINIDDCWSEMKRDPKTNKLVPDQQRFPDGIPALAQYIHSKGLKFGIYSDIGTKTCAGYPGHLQEGSTEGGKPKDYFSLDAQTFADWNVDSLKVDGCYANTTDFSWMYPSLGDELNKTSRPILYSCSWPAYVVGEGKDPDYASIAEHCNLWRNFNDIMDSWPSVLEIIDFYASHQDLFEKYHGPGQWFDPDMIIVGDFGLSVDEARAQFALWSMMSAPLLMSNDLRTISPEFQEILLNRHVIAVDQDPLGHLGKRLFVSPNKAIEVWAKRLSGGSFAVVYFNRGVLGTPKWVSYRLESIIKGILAKNELPVDEDDDNSVDVKQGGSFQEQEDENESEKNQQVLNTILDEEEAGFEDHDFQMNHNNNRYLRPEKRRAGKLVDEVSSRGGKLAAINETEVKQDDDRMKREKGIESHTTLDDLYYIVDLFAGEELIAKLTPRDNLVLKVNLSGVRMVKVIPRTASSYSYRQHLPPLFRPRNQFQ